MGYDVAVIGGGVAGMSAAAFLSPEVDVVVLEAAPMLSYHASGRSAALYTECYGPGIIPTLTTASRPFLMDRARPLGSPRGLVFVADAPRAGAIDAAHRSFSANASDLDRLDHDACLERFPVLDPSTRWTGIHEPGALDLDIGGLEADYRSTVLDNRGRIDVGTAVTALSGGFGRPWTITSSTQTLEADIVVNAAGAWGDLVAGMAGVRPLGLRPLRRSAFITTCDHPSSGSWPMVVDIDERWYCKPEGPNLLGSAADEVPSEPTDARPAELEIALAIERINEATTLGIRSVSRTWAGLRTFTPDRLPAIGPDADDATFVWAVGQGGYGIKTSPAIGALVAGLILAGAVPSHLASRGVTEAELSPRRFR